MASKRNGRSRDDIILNYLFTRSGSVAGNSVFYLFMLLVNSFGRGKGEGERRAHVFSGRAMHVVISRRRRRIHEFTSSRG